MKALYFDCFSGVSGDMMLGALMDLGVDKDLFFQELNKLNLTGYDIRMEKKVKYGITVTDVEVIVHEDHRKIEEKRIEENNLLHNHSHEHSHHDARNLSTIEMIIDASSLKDSVKSFSKKVFREIAKAEAKVHNKDINSVHFHEVGALDSIIDIVGTAICMDLLGVSRVFSSPLHDGKGFIHCQHGIIPVPVPAVMEMLSDAKIPLITEDINTELVTPTGIGLIKCLTRDFGNMPAMIIDKVGYGAGKRETGRLNALRVVMGTIFGGDNWMEEVSILETNIDDMKPEVLGYVLENLLKNGALDAFYTPVYMKKNRPGVILTVLAESQTEEKLADIILKETSTLGIRKTSAKRYVMDRHIETVATEFGDIRVKVATKGDFTKISPEFDDCREAAIRSGLPLWKVYDVVDKSSKFLL